MGKWFSLITVSFKVYSKLNSPSLKHSRRTMEREEPEKELSLKIFQVQGKTHILLHISIWQKHYRESLIVYGLPSYRMNLKIICKPLRLTVQFHVQALSPWKVHPSHFLINQQFLHFYFHRVSLLTWPS